MKSIYFSLLLIISLTSCVHNKPIQNATPDVIHHDLSKQQNQLIDRVITQLPNNTQFAIAIIDAEQEIHYGLKRENNKIISIDNQQSVFEIGSISKVMTCHLMMNMFLDGKINNLDEAIQQYLPDEVALSTPISFKQLANHTSGLPSSPTNWKANIFNHKNPYANYSYDKLDDYLKNEIVLNTPPGQQYKYSNIGMSLLGYSLMKIARTDYENLLQQQIFKPLEMSNSTTERSKIEGKLVGGTNTKGRPAPNWDLNAIEAAGAVLSTTEDLAKYAKWCVASFQEDYKPLSQLTHAHNEKMDIALGWHIIKGQTENPLIWHNGATGAYKSSMALNINEQQAVIILTNLGRKNRKLIDQLCFDLMKTLE